MGVTPATPDNTSYAGGVTVEDVAGVAGVADNGSSAVGRAFRIAITTIATAATPATTMTVPPICDRESMLSALLGYGEMYFGWISTL